MEKKRSSSGKHIKELDGEQPGERPEASWRMRSCVSFASQWAPSWVLTDGKSFQLLRSPCDLSKAFHQVEGHESERTRQSCGSYKTWYHETIRKLFSKYSFGNAKGIKYTNRSIQKSYGSLTYEKKETKNQYVKKNKRRKGRMEGRRRSRSQRRECLSAGQGMCELLSPSCSRILVVETRAQ